MRNEPEPALLFFFFCLLEKEKTSAHTLSAHRYNFLVAVSQNGSQVMAVVLTGTEAEVRREEQEMSDITKTRQAAELLSSRAENGTNLFQSQRSSLFFLQ